MIVLFWQSGWFVLRSRDSCYNCSQFLWKVLIRCQHIIHNYLKYIKIIIEKSFPIIILINNVTKPFISIRKECYKVNWFARKTIKTVFYKLKVNPDETEIFYSKTGQESLVCGCYFSFFFFYFLRCCIKPQIENKHLCK